jgi:hypothetical protein
LERKAGFQIIENYIGRKATEYTINGTIFSENYNVEDTAREYKDDMVDKD